MASLRFTKPATINGDRLTRELATAGVQATDVRVEGAELVVGGDAVTEGQRTAIQAVINAHNGAPTEQDLRSVNARQKVVDALASLHTADTNWASLTNAQKDAAMHLAVRVAEKLGRVVLNQFDVSEA